MTRPATAFPPAPRDGAPRDGAPRDGAPRDGAPRWDESWERGDGELTASQAAGLAAWYRAGDPSDEADWCAADWCEAAVAGGPSGWDGGPDLGQAPEPQATPPELAWLSVRRWGDGGGFDAGGVADRIRPGPVLAGLAAGKHEAGLSQVPDDELAGLMIAWRRLASWVTANEWSAIAELDRRRAAAVAAGADPRLTEHVCDEIAMALTLTPRAADLLVDRAVGLARLPLTAAALRAGDIDEPRARVILEELSGLSGPHAARVEAQVVGAATRQTTGQLRRSARRAVIAADPHAARIRKQRAEKNARVERWTEQAGTAALAGRDLPPAETLAADAHLTCWAERLRRAGVMGSLDHLRARVYLTLLSGQHPESLLPTDGAGATSTSAPTSTDVPTGTNASTSTNASTGQAGSGWPAGSNGPAVRGTVNLVLPLATWLGWSSAPGEVTGFGPLDEHDSRTLAAALARDPATTWCLTLTGADGRAVAHGCAQAGPSQPPGRQPGKPPRPRQPPGGQPGPEQGLPPGGQPGPEQGLPPSGGPDGTGPPRPPADVAAWLAGVTLAWLESGPCSHRRETPGYRPSRRLAHLIRVRHPTCSAPGCRRPATACDFEHTIAYQRGGRTCECNGHPCCRHHHKAKQVGGWWLEQPSPDVLIWHTPHGRSYTTLPDPYLA